MTYCYIFCTCGENVGKIQAKEKAKYWIIKILSFLSCTQTRGRTGMEVNPLVFETSASTDSAIWACLTSQMRCKDTAFF